MASPTYQPGARPDGTRPNSVNLRSQALGTLLDKMDLPDRNKPLKPPTKRNFVRWPYRHEAVAMRLVHPGGNEVMIRVACRNLSRGGMSVLHSSYIHPNSECAILLPHPVRGTVETPGKIVRCMHRSGVIHEIGVCFNQPIKVREFLAPDPFSQCFSLEHVVPADLRGTVLLIDPSTVDRQVFRHFIRDTHLKVEAVGSLAEAVLLCAETDIVVATTQIQEADPAGVVSTLRECGFTGPVVLVVPDASQQTRAKLAGLNIGMVIVKPITQDLLMRALGEMLLVEQAGQARRGADSSGPSTIDVAAQLDTLGLELYQASCAKDSAGVRRVCGRLRELAETMQWTTIMELARQVMTPLNKGHGISQVAVALDALVAACTSGPAGAC